MLQECLKYSRELVEARKKERQIIITNEDDLKLCELAEFKAIIDKTNRQLKNLQHDNRS
jgi:hypothetical protein